MSKFIDNDDFLLQMLRSGDHHAMTILFREYSSMVQRIICRTIGDLNVAKDLTQELFITIWEKRNELHIQKPIKAYLIRAAVNESFYYLRKKGENQKLRISTQENSDPLLADIRYSPENDITFKELEEHFRGVIENLPPKCKIVYRLHRDEEMTYEQIAKSLNISVKAVEKHITRALKSLRGAFKTLMILFMGL